MILSAWNEHVSLCTNYDFTRKAMFKQHQYNACTCTNCVKLKKLGADCLPAAAGLTCLLHQPPRQLQCSQSQIYRAEAARCRPRCGGYQPRSDKCSLCTWQRWRLDCDTEVACAGWVREARTDVLTVRTLFIFCCFVATHDQAPACITEYQLINDVKLSLIDLLHEEWVRFLRMNTYNKAASVFSILDLQSW